ncbi:Holliday junction ATP-dependent DNA helicase RuvA [bioreactor metagenome]|jgi:Holliday junction DNA helicase RuvA|uniref:Holliday junction ATP-dependent DNA helicase RuvA n=1 Tax=bioreactor metagenome TaxID=1076179 RepID=A0A645F0L1_9ZZZZ
MIGFLAGSARVQKDSLLIVIQGVGFQVSVPQHLWQQVQAAGEMPLELKIHPYIKEDRFELYGFQTDEEMEIFRMMLAISGVGPKMAMGLIDQGTTGLITAVQEAKVAFFTAAPRVGKKLAQKIIIELKGKLGSLKELNLGSLSSQQQDVLDALLGLGFEENQARDIMGQIDMEELSVEQALKEAIRLLSSGSERS